MRGKALSPEEARERAPGYLRQARKYQLNVGPLLVADDAEKAGEALWGAVASALKAHALVHSARLLRAAEVATYGASLARQVRMTEEFAAVKSLHANFYDRFLDPGDVRLLSEKGLGFLERVAADTLQRMAPRV